MIIVKILDRRDGAPNWYALKDGERIGDHIADRPYLDPNTAEVFDVPTFISTLRAAAVSISGGIKDLEGSLKWAEWCIKRGDKVYHLGVSRLSGGGRGVDYLPNKKGLL